MAPINQVFLGSGLGTVDDIDLQIRKMEEYKQKLRQFQNQQIPLIWDDIDMEVSSMTDDQKAKLFQDGEYVSLYNEVQAKVQTELLNLVKGKIESTPEGKELLQNQLKVVRKLKGKIIEESNRELELFRKFKEFSKTNPEVTYEEFIKTNM